MLSRVICLLLLPQLACSFVALRAPSRSARRAGVPQSRGDFDPFSAPRGPPLDKGQQPLRPPPTPASPADIAADGETAIGARVIGAGIGGLAGNKLYAGVERIGLLTCSPFNLDGCATTRPPDRPAVPKPSGGGTESMDNFPFADILRNPTSILPKEWNLTGRKYLEDAKPPPVAVEAPSAAVQPPQLDTTPTPPAAIEAPQIALPQPVPAPDAPSRPSLEELQQLREELARLKQTLSSTGEPMAPGTARASAPPAFVPPATAAEPDAALLQWLHEHGASHGEAIGMVAFGSDHAHASSLVEEYVGFAAVAEGDGGPGGLIATLFSAALGAFVFEYLATNKNAPIPDPLLGGIWGTLHAAVRFPSKIVGGGVSKVIGAAKGAMPF